jgi:hypothetical protein
MKHCIMKTCSVSELDKVSGQLHALAALSREKRPGYSLDGRLGGLQSWSQCCGEGKSLASPGIGPRPSSP